MYKKKIIESFTFLIIGAGCAPISFLQPDYSSLLDVKYKLSLQKRNSKNPETGSISFYQSFLSPVLNSTCHHYPTDSRYAKNLFSKCDWPQSIVKTTSRFLSESDAAILYPKITIENNRVYFVDIPERCSL
jgi:hypothetical protein